ncbi:GNAT family N-acetyltransferase [Enterococcus mediterraneensis]|uniref:GNAT family N-acetyltransferase n=1 Tax=Enterococcus mediterraneensis TaxID=2364791 RepID=UPI000F06E88F|nr:GNAT family N-acetyltransferase [Enterococcus mediterraneensis]
MDYHRITEARAADLQLPNEEFELFGRMLVSRRDEKWQYDTTFFETKETMRFPDEGYTYKEVDEKGFAIGAYEGQKCVGLAIFENQWGGYAYLQDLKVNKAYRNQGIAGKLIEKGRALAKENGYQGVFTIGQDNNLAACLFYLKQGFVVGGLNTQVYRHTQQEGKADIYFYLDE